MVNVDCMGSPATHFVYITEKVNCMYFRMLVYFERSAHSETTLGMLNYNLP